MIGSDKRRCCLEGFSIRAKSAEMRILRLGGKFRGSGRVTAYPEVTFNWREQTLALIESSISPPGGFQRCSRPIGTGHLPNSPFPARKNSSNHVHALTGWSMPSGFSVLDCRWINTQLLGHLPLRQAERPARGDKALR